MKDEAWKACKEQTEKSLRLMGAQNEVCEMAIKANAELEQVNARLAALSHHYEALGKRSDDLKDEGLIQVQIVEDMRELCLNDAFELALKYAEIVDGKRRYDLISRLNAKSWEERPHNRVDDIRAAVKEHEMHDGIPF